MKKSLNSAFSAYALSDIGRVRHHNEDSTGIIRGPFFTVLGVFDGMGGSKGGQEASRACWNALRDVFSSLTAPFGLFKAKALLKEALGKANDAIYEKAEADPLYEGMGSTAVVAIVLERQTLVANVGDSRCYVLHKNDKKIVQITHDQSYVQNMYDHGKISKDELLHSPSRNILTNAIGTQKPLKGIAFSLLRNAYDDLMLCSDGLYNLVPDEQATAILRSENPVEKKCLTLIDKANEHGGNDNSSVALYEVQR